MPLSHMACQAAKPKMKPYKMADGEGLYLEVTPSGTKYWRLKYRKEKLGYVHEIADRQLAHVPKSSVDRVYDRAVFLPQRIQMMQEYADYIDGIG